MVNLTTVKRALAAAGIMDADAAQAERATWPMFGGFDEPVQAYVTFLHSGPKPVGATIALQCKAADLDSFKARVRIALTAANVPFIEDNGRIYL